MTVGPQDQVPQKHRSPALCGPCPSPRYTKQHRDLRAPLPSCRNGSLHCAWLGRPFRYLLLDRRPDNSSERGHLSGGGGIVRMGPEDPFPSWAHSWGEDVQNITGKGAQNAKLSSPISQPGQAPLSVWLPLTHKQSRNLVSLSRAGTAEASV